MPLEKAPWPLWAACTSALSTSNYRSFSWCLYETSNAPVCTHCPLSCYWASLKRTWPHHAWNSKIYLTKYAVFKYAYCCFSGRVKYFRFLKQSNIHKNWNLKTVWVTVVVILTILRNKENPNLNLRKKMESWNWKEEHAALVSLWGIKISVAHSENVTFTVIPFYIHVMKKLL